MSPSDVAVPPSSRPGDVPSPRVTTVAIAARVRVLGIRGDRRDAGLVAALRHVPAREHVAVDAVPSLVLRGQFHDPGKVLASLAWSIGIVAIAAGHGDVYHRST